MYTLCYIIIIPSPPLVKMENIENIIKDIYCPLQYRYYGNDGELASFTVDSEGLLHSYRATRDGVLEPAYTRYDVDGKISCMIWASHGYLHNENDKPALMIQYDITTYSYTWLQFGCIYERPDEKPNVHIRNYDGISETMKWFDVKDFKAVSNLTPDITMEELRKKMVGKIHRDSKPALIIVDGNYSVTVGYYEHGVLIPSHKE